MSMQPAVQPRSSANGFGRRNRETGIRPESKLQSGKSNPNKLTNAGVSSGSKGGVYESPSRDRLVYLTTCLLGHHVDVQVKNGSVFSGIFHATSMDKDFGIVLKMAQLVKEGGSFRGQKANSDSINKAPSKTFIVAAKDLVQITAKGVSVTKDGFAEELQRKKQQEILIDSSISQSRHAEVERELERWVPDEDVPQRPELDNTFDSPWNRNWDQFETNEALFGVKSTFNEEIYTTKLERGPQTRELEREAIRIAREIEGEDTKDLHLAEERGLQLHESFDIDDETKYSSVFRGVDDSGYEENEDVTSDLRNDETFGGSTSDISGPFADLASGKSTDGAQALPSTSSMDEIQSRQSSTVRDVFNSSSNDHARETVSELPYKIPPALDGESRIQENHSSDQQGGKSIAKGFAEKEMFTEDAQTSKCEDTDSLLNMNKDGSDKAELSPNATTHDPSSGTSSVVGQEKTNSPGELPEVLVSGKSNEPTQTVNSRGRPGSSTSSASDNVGAAPAASGPSLSPSSSMGSLSSEKSTLNPNAKEFKLNPNAKSFVPSQAPVRPPSPVADGSFYYPSNIAPISHMHGMPMGIGIGPSFAAHQPVMFNPQAVAMQSPQQYYHPNGPQYGQQMILGPPRPVMYMPNYPPEMQYKGREYQ